MPRIKYKVMAATQKMLLYKSDRKGSKDVSVKLKTVTQFISELEVTE